MFDQQPLRAPLKRSMAKSANFNCPARSEYLALLIVFNQNHDEKT